MRHCEVRDGLLVMKMSSILFCLVGVVIICSVWVVISMSKKRLLMSEGYECPCMLEGKQSSSSSQYCAGQRLAPHIRRNPWIFVQSMDYA